MVTSRHKHHGSQQNPSYRTFSIDNGGRREIAGTESPQTGKLRFLTLGFGSQAANKGAEYVPTLKRMENSKLVRMSTLISETFIEQQCVRDYKY